MSNYDPLHPLSEDKEFEEALAFVANLRKNKEANDTPPSQAESTDMVSLADIVATAEDLSFAENATGMVSLADLAMAATSDFTQAENDENPTEEAETPAQKSGLGARFLHAVIPFAGDPWWEIGRKLLMLVALVVFIGSIATLINESVIIPQQNEDLSAELEKIYQGHTTPELVDAVEKYDGYPEGINTDLKTLYYLNQDLRGWLTYSPCGINREVMYSGDNDFYLEHDFYKNYNKNGALFFDAKNNLSTASAHYKSLVIYGHNMASGQMFAQLNELAKSVEVMKRANAIIKLDTLFSSSQYKIFAVMLQDSRSKIQHYYSIQETHFANNTAFMKYVDGLRARSLYDFPDVDVKASDDILILYTCTPKSIGKFDEARLAVVARRVRSGESPTVSSANIRVNSDVIMPYVWYTAQNKKPHSFYSTGQLPGNATTAGGKATTAGGKATTAGGKATTAGGKATTAGGKATTAGGKVTTTAGNKATTTPPAAATTAPPAAATTAPSAAATTAPSAAATTAPPAAATTAPPAAATTTAPTAAPAAPAA